METPTTPPAVDEVPRRRKLIAVVLAIVAVVVTGVGVWVLVSGPDPVPVAQPPAPVVTPDLPAETSAPPTAVQVAEPAQSPGTVRLPEGGTAKLIRKEVTADGVLPIPDGLDEATWWGAKLGDGQGAALLSGHVNWKRQNGPFDELWRSNPGQEVSVVDTGGGQWKYRITEVVTLHKSELPDHAQRLFGQDGPHRLVLVTCGGDYVGGTEGYEDNRIVTAELVSRP
ncbi:class F sortase [Amycolatopsis sp. 195334CR]|uniref:class F sortase n=1 Tax=Amycolatopsis sp. 195334CR TaxID=2814588 RepID=UPI0027DDCD8D|nr:class F sortase [Amycolatopsis sp. 195334CR]